MLDTELSAEQRDRADTAPARRRPCSHHRRHPRLQGRGRPPELEAIESDLRNTLDDVTGLLGDRATAKD
jgi:hypothetical protein